MAADLTAIITKVRRLTRTPSTAQLSDADITEYINTFTIYDFPEQLRTFNFRETFSWTCNPFQDEYPIDIDAGVFNQLRNFKNLYITIHPPLYIAGFQQMYTQSREQFFGIYPQVRSIASIGQFGDGVTTQFTGTINANQAIIAPGQVTPNTILQRKVLFSSFGTNGNSLAMVDVPLVDPTTFQFLPIGNLYQADSQPTDPLNFPTVVDPNNTINYVTGQFTVTFPFAPGNQVPIDSQSVPAAVGIPQAMLFYDNMFTLRPVPDQPYTIDFEVYRRPFSLNAISNPNPALEEYAQLIAYGAARKVFQDRMDPDSLTIVEPEFREQMRLCLRRSIVQYTNERTSTIYTEQTQFGIQNNGFGFGGGSF
jgi:hypothetical protein